MMELPEVIRDIADILKQIDESAIQFRAFKPGVGPWGEPQLMREVVHYLNVIPAYAGKVKTKRTPDLLITDEWAIEIKLTRPFGDNGKEAENWSVNLLHPYPGNVSAIGDCLKLVGYSGDENKAILVIGYEHDPAQISLDPLIEAFEVTTSIFNTFCLKARIEERREGLIHPVHQVVRLFAWELIS